MTAVTPHLMSSAIRPLTRRADTHTHTPWQEHVSTAEETKLWDALDNVPLLRQSVKYFPQTAAKRHKV